MSLNNEVLVFVSIGHGFEEVSARRNADRFPSAILSSACKKSFERTLSHVQRVKGEVGERHSHSQCAWKRVGARQFDSLIPFLWLLSQLELGT